MHDSDMEPTQEQCKAAAKHLDSLKVSRNDVRVMRGRPRLDSIPLSAAKSAYLSACKFFGRKPTVSEMTRYMASIGVPVSRRTLRRLLEGQN